MTNEGWYFRCNINTRKLEVENAILCWNMKYFSLLGSVSKERIVKQRIGKWQDCKFILYRSEKKSANERCQGLS